MDKLRYLSQIFSEFHIERTLESQYEGKQLDLYNLSEEELEDLYINVRFDIWENIDKFLSEIPDKSNIEDLMNKREFLEELCEELNSFMERDKYLVIEDKLTIGYYIGNDFTNAYIPKKSICYIGHYLTEYFYKNLKTLVDSFIESRTTVLK